MVNSARFADSSTFVVTAAMSEVLLGQPKAAVPRRRSRRRIIGPYTTATAFRVALEERLRQRALESGTPLDRLRKEVAFQRLFARMTASDVADGWVLKGAQVLLIRLDERARATKDADTTWRYEASELQAALDEAMELDLGDGFSFEIGSRSRLEAETEDGGWRYSVRSRLDGRLFEQFVLDVNVSPDDLRPVDQLTFRRVLDFAGMEPQRSPQSRLRSTSRRNCMRTYESTPGRGRRAE